MARWLSILLLAVLPLQAALRLYLKDGSYQSIREYQVLEDRVRYYSMERSAWEEIPLDLIDLKRTREEEARNEAERKAEAVVLDAEDKAEREAAREVARVPQATGVYWVNGDQLLPLEQAKADIVKDKKRSLLKILTPVPVVAGKSTLEIDGAKSAFAVPPGKPEFYFRLYALERFGIVKLDPRKDSRVVETWNTLPVSNELVQEHTDVETFQQQVGDGLYKIWPREPLDPGEYAFIEFTRGAGNTQVWDFSVRTAAKP